MSDATRTIGSSSTNSVAALSSGAWLRIQPQQKPVMTPVQPLAHPGDRVLLLQGPYGPFFRQLAAHLRQIGATVQKINFNGGDAHYYPGPDATDYLGNCTGFPSFLREFLTTHRINRVFLFADCRPHHQQAIRICQERGIPVRVFEEGYLRPDYITCEEHGINGYSLLPRDPAFYMAQPDMPVPAPVPAGGRFGRLAWFVAVYHVVSALRAYRYPQYDHHKALNPLYHAARWVLSGMRKALYRTRDARLTARLASRHSNNFFLVPLQVFDDTQVVFHSGYGDVTDFIRDVVASFAAHAPADKLLVLKHHPMDRGYRHYGRLVRELAAQHGLGKRLVYTHDVHLPTCLDHARGVITINSTVGLSAIWHGTPVKTLGRAVYDMPGLTHQGDLADFWHAPGKPDDTLHRKFRAYLVRYCQINSSFYARRARFAPPGG